MPPRPSRRCSSYRPLNMTWFCCDMRSPGYEMGVSAPESGAVAGSAAVTVPTILPFLRLFRWRKGLCHHRGRDRGGYPTPGLLARARLALDDHGHGHVGHLALRAGETDDP